MCRRHPDRTAGVRADADNSEVRRERRASAPEEPPMAYAVL
jgi:hypothetical protein